MIAPDLSRIVFADDKQFLKSSNFLTLNIKFTDPGIPLTTQLSLDVHYLSVQFNLNNSILHCCKATRKQI